MCITLYTHPEVCENILSLYILSSKPDLSEGMILIILKFSKGNLKDSVLETFRSDLPYMSHKDIR